MSDTPKLSVLTVTYNHERYIAEAVESALAQQTSFPFEIVVGEDCSTDCTRQILLDLARRHPQMRLILQERNLGGTRNFAATLAACRGQYVAMLEGDDYWTHPLKLQKQVDALDEHPDWAMCFHLTRRVYQDGSRPPEVYPPDWTRDVATIDDLFVSNFMNTCSIVFRNRLFGDLPHWHFEISPGDWALSLLNAAHGSIGCIREVLADYRMHAQGMWVRKGRAEQLREILKLLSFVDHHFHGTYRRQIDAYRQNMVNSLVHEIESIRHSEAVLIPPLLNIPRTRQRTRESAPYRMIRQVMRPVERLFRRGRAALGSGKKAA